MRIMLHSDITEYQIWEELLRILDVSEQDI